MKLKKDPTLDKISSAALVKAFEYVWLFDDRIGRMFSIQSQFAIKRRKRRVKPTGSPSTIFASFLELGGQITEWYNCTTHTHSSMHIFIHMPHAHNYFYWCACAHSNMHSLYICPCAQLFLLVRKCTKILLLGSESEIW